MTFTKINIHKQEDQIKRFPLKVAFLSFAVVATLAINVAIFSAGMNELPIVDVENSTKVERLVENHSKK